MASITSARPALLPTGYLSLSLAFRDRVHVIMAYFNLGKLTCVSAPHYKSEADYNRPTRLQSQGGTGDWRLDNFLRQSLGDWPGETVETWEARVAELWNIAGDGQSWSDLDLTVDDQEIGGKALSLERNAFVPALLPDCDLEVELPRTRVARPPALQRMTIEELQPVLDEWRRRRPVLSSDL